MKRYMVQEIFYSLQGEGVRAGTAAVFIRFSKCNLCCNKEEHGFDCDQYPGYEQGTWYTIGELLDEVRHLSSGGWIILTGGEPALQIDQPLVDVFHGAGYHLAIETNGTKYLPKKLDWVCVSPKPGTRVVVTGANEVKYVLSAGMEPGDRAAVYQLVSPAFKGDEPDPDAVAWCVQWVLDHPEWRLSYQVHKALGVR